MPEYSHAEMHRIFRYEGHDPKNVGKVLPGPANSPEAGTQVLKDWNRRMESYYINGVMLKDILEREFDPAKHTKIWDEERQKEVIVFNDIQAIKEFFLHHLLLNDQERESWNHTKQQLEALNENADFGDLAINNHKVNDLLQAEFDPEKHEKIIDEQTQQEKIKFKDDKSLFEFMARHMLPPQKEFLLGAYLQHLHQSGLPHATNTVIYGALVDNDVMLSQPEVRVDFVPNEQGLFIREHNTYETRRDLETGEYVKPKDGGFFAKTTTEVMFTAWRNNENMEMKLEVKNLQTESQKELKHIFEPRNVLQKIMDFFSNIGDKIRSVFSKDRDVDFRKAQELLKTKLQEEKAELKKETVEQPAQESRIKTL